MIKGEQMVLRLYFQIVLSPPSFPCNSITPDCRGEMTRYPPPHTCPFRVYSLCPSTLMAVVLITAHEGCQEPGTVLNVFFHGTSQREADVPL